MRRAMKEIVKGQRGEVMLEASIILVAVLILLMALLSITFMFYQQALMTTIAVETADEIAKNLKFTDLKIGANTLKASDYQDVQMFRTNFGQFSLEDDKEDLAKKYVASRLKLASFGLNPGEVECSVDLKASGIGRMYAVVTVSQKTDFFLSGILDMLDITSEKTLFSTTVYAECTDLIGYTSMVNFTDYLTGKLGLLEPLGDLYGSLRNLAQNLMGK